MAYLRVKVVFRRFVYPTPYFSTSFPHSLHICFHIGYGLPEPYVNLNTPHYPLLSTELHPKNSFKKTPYYYFYFYLSSFPTYLYSV